MPPSPNAVYGDSSDGFSSHARAILGHRVSRCLEQLNVEGYVPSRIGRWKKEARDAEDRLGTTHRL